MAKQVVIGVLADHDHPSYEPAYFVAKREGKAYAGCWEFPGGKVEAGEIPEDALVREWQEGHIEVVTPPIYRGRFTTVDLTDFEAIAYRVTAETHTSPRSRPPPPSKWLTRAEILALPDESCTPSLKPIAAALPDWVQPGTLVV